MPRWVIVVIVTPLALCAVCASLGYIVAGRKLGPVFEQMHDELAQEMANSVTASVSDKIARSPTPLDRLVLTAADLDVNNVESLGGECGFELAASATSIYGVETEIGSEGISITCGVTYSAVPVVENGRVELTEPKVSHEVADFLLSKGAFEEGLEGGINRGLASHHLTPTAIKLSRGLMTIEVAHTP